tara:strand:+ start:2708 stop:2917 length:210 start_codon:yes stop_codon:yes gene_type:complete
MINTTNPINPPTDELCEFIICKLGISKKALDLGIKRACLENSPLPVVMWSYGLISLSQYNSILLWQKDS